ncbi:MAG: WD40 repeat domain-containing protein, partial [Chloroflexaceae bacterium]|nr:WD40 repeat domain-containing protein [Chloroflexaceae bacterium]
WPSRCARPIAEDEDAPTFPVPSALAEPDVPEIIEGALSLRPDVDLAQVQQPLTAANIGQAEQLGLLRLNQISTAYAIAYAPDGSEFAIAGANGIVQRWAVGAQGVIPQEPFFGSFAILTTLAYSPSGQVLAAADEEGEVYLWDVASGSLRSSMYSDLLGVFALIFTATEDQVLVGGNGGLHRLRLDDPVVLQRYTHDTGAMVLGLALTPDQTLLAGGLSDNTIGLWDAASGEQIRILNGHEDWVRAVAFSPDGQLLASVSDDTTVRLWDVASGQEVQVLRAHDDWVRAVAFSPDGQLLASGGDDTVVNLWRVQDGTLLTQLAQDETGFSADWVYGVAFAPDGQALVAVTSSGGVRQWQLGTEIQAQPIQSASVPPLNQIALAPNDRTLAIATSRGTVQVYDLLTGAPQGEMLSHGGNVFAVAFADNGRLLASGGDDGIVRVWDTDGYGLRSTLRLHSDWVRSVAFSPDSSTLASGGDDTQLVLWDLATDQEQVAIQAHDDWLRALAFSPDGAIVATASDDGTVQLWQTTTGMQLATLESNSGGWLMAVAFSPDGRLVAAGSDSGMVELWRVDDGISFQRSFSNDYGIQSLTFAPDGSLLVAGTMLNTTLFDANTGEILHILPSAFSSVPSALFTSDGRLLLTGVNSGMVQVWGIAP